jgi:hypothetical protein
MCSASSKLADGALHQRRRSVWVEQRRSRRCMRGVHGSTRPALDELDPTPAAPWSSPVCSPTHVGSTLRHASRFRGCATISMRPGRASVCLNTPGDSPRSLRGSESVAAFVLALDLVEVDLRHRASCSCPVASIAIDHRRGGRCEALGVQRSRGPHGAPRSRRRRAVPARRFARAAAGPRWRSPRARARSRGASGSPCRGRFARPRHALAASLSGSAPRSGSAARASSGQAEHRGREPRAGQRSALGPCGRSRGARTRDTGPWLRARPLQPHAQIARPARSLTTPPWSRRPCSAGSATPRRTAATPRGGRTS